MLSRGRAAWQHREEVAPASSPGTCPDLEDSAWGYQQVGRGQLLLSQVPDLLSSAKAEWIKMPLGPFIEAGKRGKGLYGGILEGTFLGGKWP